MYSERALACLAMRIRGSLEPWLEEISTAAILLFFEVSEQLVAEQRRVRQRRCTSGLPENIGARVNSGGSHLGSWPATTGTPSLIGWSKAQPDRLVFGRVDEEELARFDAGRVHSHPC